MADKRWFSLAKCLKTCLFYFVFVISTEYGHAIDTGCIEMKKVYREKGFNDNDVPHKAITLSGLSSLLLCLFRNYLTRFLLL